AVSGRGTIVRPPRRAGAAGADEPVLNESTPRSFEDELLPALAARVPVAGRGVELVRVQLERIGVGDAVGLLAVHADDAGERTFRPGNRPRSDRRGVARVV